MSVTKKRNINRILITLTIIALIMISIIVIQFFVFQNLTSNYVASETYVNGLNISGLNNEEAIEKLSSNFKDTAEKFNLNITYEDKSWQFDKNDFTVTSDIHTILEVAQIRENESSTHEQQINIIDQFYKKGSSVNVAFNYLFNGLDEKIDMVIKEIEIEPINSEIKFLPNEKNMFEITKSKVGKRVNKTQLYEDINNQFLKSPIINVSIKLIDEAPTITEEYNNQLTQKISEFTSNVSDSTGGRKKNVNLALDKFNGMVVAPGEQISFNKVTGPHTKDNGYQNAIIIYKGQFVDGIGGGICQASSTLYNAILLSGLQIDEVNKHSLPVKYVPLALDAMVAEYTSDFKFTNNTDYPIFIKTYHNENSVTAEIYSHTIPDNIKYSTRSETIRTIPHSGDIIKKDINEEYTDKVLFEGEFYRLSYPKDGYEAKAYLQTVINDEIVEEKEIRHEIYQQQNGIIIEGASEVPSGMNIIESNVKIITN